MEGGEEGRKEWMGRREVREGWGGGKKGRGTGNVGSND